LPLSSRRFHYSSGLQPGTHFDQALVGGGRGALPGLGPQIPPQDRVRSDALEATFEFQNQIQIAELLE
jgi:hypothetical protein